MRTLLTLLLGAFVVSAKKPHIVQIVVDDLGYNDIGVHNDYAVKTPKMNQLIKEGVRLTSYYTFKICSPSRASLMTGRYPWGAGFYDMTRDEDHCTRNFTLIPQLMKDNGYRTHAIGKWDVGFAKKECSPTERGFDTFLGYYLAANADLFYHWAPLSTSCKDLSPDFRAFDFSNSTLTAIKGADTSVNGTYSTNVFTAEAVKIIKSVTQDESLYLYYAPQNVHLARGVGLNLGIQAHCSTVDMYPYVVNDTYKAQSAVMTELDWSFANITAALHSNDMWDNTLIVVVSDNGGPLAHTTNFPLRGGKHSFWEGGVRVESFISGGLVPESRRGTNWDGLAHSSDWYKVFVEGVAGGSIPANTGPRLPDGHNLLPAIFANEASPRSEVVHQVANQYFSENVTSIRMGDFKLIITSKGNVGDTRILKWPELSATATPFGESGGQKQGNQCRAPSGEGSGTKSCIPHCLFNVVDDISESHDLSKDPQYANLITNMTKRLEFHGSTGPDLNLAYIVPLNKFGSEILPGLCEGMKINGVLEPIDAEE